MKFVDAIANPVAFSDSDCIQTFAFYGIKIEQVNLYPKTRAQPFNLFTSIKGKQLAPFISTERKLTSSFNASEY